LPIQPGKKNFSNRRLWRISIQKSEGTPEQKFKERKKFLFHFNQQLTLKVTPTIL
jgi:hypothetical protein